MLKMPTVLWKGKDAHLSQGAADKSQDENPEREVPL